LLALCVAGIHALAAAADYEVDRAAGHRTIAVAFGRRSAAAFALCVFLAAWLFGGFTSDAVRVYLASCALAAAAAIAWPHKTSITVACTMIFAAFPVAAVLYFLGW
jgi:4-hydroxybenzoate polyprenyltransferase